LKYHTCDTSVDYPPGLTKEQFISFVRNTVNEIVLFTMPSYSISQRCRNTVTFAKTLFTDPVDSETTVNREREKIITQIDQS
jgi:hypothetical protein